jgi:hypothetical protein
MPRFGLDALPGTLEVARGAIKAYTAKRISLEIIDLLQPVSMSQLPPSLDEGAVGVISTCARAHSTCAVLCGFLRDHETWLVSAGD